MQKNNESITLTIAIIVGLGIGILLKKARFGFVLGLILGVVIVFFIKKRIKR